LAPLPFSIGVRLYGPASSVGTWNWVVQKTGFIGSMSRSSERTRLGAAPCPVNGPLSHDGVPAYKVQHTPFACLCCRFRQPAPRPWPRQPPPRERTGRPLASLSSVDQLLPFLRQGSGAAASTSSALPLGDVRVMTSSSSTDAESLKAASLPQPGRSAFAATSWLHGYASSGHCDLLRPRPSVDGSTVSPQSDAKVRPGPIIPSFSRSMGQPQGEP